MCHFVQVFTFAAYIPFTIAQRRRGTCLSCLPVSLSKACAGSSLHWQFTSLCSRLSSTDLFFCVDKCWENDTVLSMMCPLLFKMLHSHCTFISLTQIVLPIYE